MTCGVGTPLYMSPEVIRGSEYNQPADVWSFGILLWEIASQQTPDLLKQEGKIRGPLLSNLLQLIEAGKQLRVERDAWPEWVCTLIADCNALNPARRPTFRDVLAHLSK
jgi:LRR receptor-like serine/threonine-protein kinase FLS2